MLTRMARKSKSLKKEDLGASSLLQIALIKTKRTKKLLSLLQKKKPLSQSFQLERSQNLLMYHHIYAILVHAVCVDRNQWMVPRLVPLLEVPEGPDDPSMPQILAMKFTFLRCQPQGELTIPPIKQAKPIAIVVSKK